MKPLISIVFTLAGVMATASATQAADIEVRLESVEAPVGVPVRAEVIVTNAAVGQAPQFPEVPGLTIEPLPQTSERTQIINGRVTRTVAYSYAITATRVGTFTIPPIQIEVDGAVLASNAVTLVAATGDTDDLLFVELRASRKQVYVGEALDLALEIWLRPFQQASTRLDANAMWSFIDKDVSHWGVFEAVLADRTRRDAVQVVPRTRVDSDGQRRGYNVYEIRQQIWPDRPGPIDPGSIRIVVNYPERLGRSDDPFDSMFGRRRLRVLESRVLAAAPTVDDIVVLPVPDQDRPPEYRGAIGPFEFAVDARPTTVRVGDPITLTMTLRGAGRLDVVQPPPLALLEQDFKVPVDPMAGIVDERLHTKTFTQSIRPKHAEVTEIPALAFVTFDPVAQTFKTLLSKPIAITVEAVETVSASQVVSAEGRPAPDTELTRLDSGLLANYTTIPTLLAPQAFAPGAGSAALVTLPPVAWAIGAVMRRRSRKRREDPIAARRRGAGKRARRRLAGHDDDVVTAGVVFQAMARYVAERTGHPSGGLTRATVLELAQQSGWNGEVTTALGTLLRTCEDRQYGGAHQAPADADLVARASECIDLLESVKA